MSNKPHSTSALNAMRVADIKALAADLGITLDAKARKADYVQAIKAKEQAASAPAVDAQPEAGRNRRKDAAAAVSELTGLARPDRAKNETSEDKDAPDSEVPAIQSGDGAAQERRGNRRERTRARGGQRVERNGRNSRSERSEGEQNEKADRRHGAGRSEAPRSEETNHGEQGEQNEHNAGGGANEDVLLPIAGILDTSGTNSYVRTGGYLPGKNDAYVSTQMIKKYGLRRGDAIVGAVRSLADSPQRRGQRQHKYNPLVEIKAINGLPPEESLQRPEFNKLTPLYPQEMLRVETTKNALTTRVVDLVAPIGKGQRGLIVSPPKAGKTVVMQQLAMAIAKNNPEVHLMVVLVDERPEEVTDMQRLVKGEVIASTFDRPASDHTIVSELAVERAKRLVELGQDVVILLDSLTRLSRAYNLAAPASGRILSGGVDAAALYPPKKFFGAARNIENGGSLTIIASALVETGSKMDEVIFEEFKGTGNMELRLSRQLADRRIFPAVDVNASGTRREELLFSPEELKIVWHLRRALGTLDVQEASDYLLGRLRKTETNKDFLVSVVKGMQAAE